MRHISLMLALAVTTVAAPAFAHDYEMKDLEALEKQEAWQEAVQHLGDIQPSKRNDAWQRIAEKASAGYLGQLDSKAVLSTSDDLMKRYPSLKKSKVFMQGRADAALKAFGKSYASSRHSTSDDPWLQSLREFVESDTLTADLPMRAGKLVSGRLVASIALPFYKKAINANAAACKDADVKSSFVSALSRGEWTDDAKALLDKSCFGDVRGAIEAELSKEGDHEDLKKNACPVFAQKKASIAACK